MEKSAPITTHQLVSGDARKMDSISNDSVHLVVTSPPYPMIEMWDEVFEKLNPAITEKSMLADSSTAYEQMHCELDKVWHELERVLAPGGIACINIGDATRTIDQNFQLYPNHSRIIEGMRKIGFVNLPNLLWRKPTNAPNKFMGSGMLPVGAYITLEHEYILIFRKGRKKKFDSQQEKTKRRTSAFFWEERNTWFSDMWELKGIKQKLRNQDRNRSAAFPFEIPHRLINMFSQVGDTVLDPFNGTGTTTLASIENGRNSIGFELSDSLIRTFKKEVINMPIESLRETQLLRLDSHRKFLNKPGNNSFLYINRHYGFKVKTRQEIDLKLPIIKSLEQKQDVIWARYEQ